jgi:membrane-bound lytic murein transglycosylase D
MKYFYLLCCFFLTLLPAVAQKVVVPSRLEFAGMKLRLTEDAREEVQKYVDALTAHPYYYQKRIDQMDAHFPIVERVLAEEGVPLDLKYLLVQESGFEPDAVSTSNAVGYWQFKDFTGREMGLRVDGFIDERMHLSASSRGAAKYLKRHNFYFNNWVHSIIAYHQGLGGAKKRVNENENGASRMTIDKNTFWYFKKFLAHKLAFENAVGKNPAPKLKLQEYHKTAGKSLRQLAKEVKVDYEELVAHNKWLRRGRVPDEKVYTLIVPVYNPEQIDELEIAEVEVEQETEMPALMTVKNHELSSRYISELDVSLKAAVSKPSSITLINGIPAVIAAEGDKISTLAQLGEISERRFRRYNDLSRKREVVAGQIYYLKKKHLKAKVHYHVVRPGETLWEVSQLYGVRLNKVMRRNRMRSDDESDNLKIGRILWMRFIRPRNHPIEFIPEKERNFAQANDTLPSLPMLSSQNVIAKIESSVNLNEEEDTTQLEEKDSELSQPEWEDKELDSLNATLENQEEDEKELFDEEQEDAELDSLNATLEKQEEEEEHELSDKDNITDNEKWEDSEELISKSVSKPVANSALPEFHRVEKGDTYYGISRQYEISVAELLEWNKLTVDQPLAIGMELRLRPASLSEQKQTEEKPAVPTAEFHEVKAGETLYAISRLYGISVQELMEWNGKQDFNVQVGEKLKLKAD